MRPFRRKGDVLVAELDVFRLHGHGLWATMQKDR